MTPLQRIVLTAAEGVGMLIGISIGLVELAVTMTVRGIAEAAKAARRAVRRG